MPITHVSSSLSPAGLGHNRAERDQYPSHRSGKIADYFGDFGVRCPSLCG
jgi:hypothetical protein